MSTQGNVSVWERLPSRGLHPPRTEFLTHACENITSPQLLLRAVKTETFSPGKISVNFGSPSHFKVKHGTEEGKWVGDPFRLFHLPRKWIQKLTCHCTNTSSAIHKAYEAILHLRLVAFSRSTRTVPVEALEYTIQ